MKLYCIISTTDGLSVTPYETIDQAVKEWLNGMEECPAKERLSMEYGAKGAQACLDEAKEMDYEDTEYLWRDGEERVEELDLDFAVSLDEHERKVDRLEGQVQDLREELPSDEHKAILEALDDAKYNGQPGILKHLSATTNAIADEYGYTSPEYAAICAITNAIAQ
jgi:polyhydroxyalkanoate synthesis regulator phasin